MITQNACFGIKSHSLPIRNGKEFIYPILIQLLNLVQEEEKVVIVSGHRCPEYNRHIGGAATSKHQIGAAVTFYVEHTDSQLIIEKILSYDPKQEMGQFVKIQGKRGVYWANREVKVELLRDQKEGIEKGEGPLLIELEVLFDRDASRRVNYSWDEAHKNLFRFN